MSSIHRQYIYTWTWPIQMLLMWDLLSHAGVHLCRSLAMQTEGLWVSSHVWWECWLVEKFVWTGKNDVGVHRIEGGGDSMRSTDSCFYHLNMHHDKEVHWLLWLLCSVWQGLHHDCRKYGWPHRIPKVKPKHVNCLWLFGYSIGHDPRLLRVS